MRPAVTLTPQASDHIKALTRGSPGGLRIGLKKGGCAGMEYTMELVEAAEANDIHVEQDGARVFLAPNAQMFLIGTEIDYKSTLLESGFDFRNPNVTDSCGCGESVSFNLSDLSQGKHLPGNARS